MAASPGEDLARARLAYEQNDWTTAIRLLRPLLHPKIQLGTEAEVIQARKLLGASYFFSRAEDRARQEFRFLLDVEPDFTMDRVVDGPEVAAFFERLKAEWDDERRRARTELDRRRKEDEARRRREEEERRRRAERIYVEVRTRERSYAVNFLPFGAGQFQNRQPGKGWAFAVAGGVLGAASLATWATVQLRWPNGLVPERESGTAASLELTHIVTGGLFFVIWGLGVLDSLEHYRAEDTQLRELPRPPGRVSLLPFAGPVGASGWGGGATLAW